MAIDPNVKKIINNGGFIAALAPVLAARTNWHPIRVSATRLGEVAEAYSKMLATLGVVPLAVIEDWEGCDQAKLLIQWIDDAESPNETSWTDKAEQMRGWTADIWAAIADLASGSVPNSE